MTCVFALALVGALGTLGRPALADDPSPRSTLGSTFEPTPIPSPERRDLYLDMPYTIGGFEPDIVMTRGAEHFANLDPAQADDAKTIADLERLLEVTGSSIEDMTSGYALVSAEDFSAFVVGVRIDDAEPGTLPASYLPILLGGLTDPTAGPAPSEGGTSSSSHRRAATGTT